MDKTVLITGIAGFIGYHTAVRFLENGWNVVGIDDYSDYYDQKLKKDRVQSLRDIELTTEGKLIDIMRWTVTDRINIEGMIQLHKPEIVIHLAGQAGVRYSIENPKAYAEANVLGHLAVAQACVKYSNIVQHLIYASSSSVYGNREMVDHGFREEDADTKVESPYAATKLANEAMSWALSRNTDLRQTGLRFFTAYGPWGRPDMAYYSFAHDILNKVPLKIFNRGDVSRDFTYISDIVDGIWAIATTVPTPNIGKHEIFNLGNNRPQSVGNMVNELAYHLGVTRPVFELLPMQPGDVKVTYANIDKMKEEYGWSPSTNLFIGLCEFVKWFREYHKI